MDELDEEEACDMGDELNDEELETEEPETEDPEIDEE